MKDCTKISFHTKAEADLRIEQTNKRNAELEEKLLTHSYLCRYCGTWHMTSKAKGTTNQEKWNRRNKYHTKDRKRRDKFYKAKHTFKRKYHQATKGYNKRKRRFTLRDKNGLVQMNPKKLTWSLTNGFVKMFGESHRELFEEHQFDMVNAGFEAGYTAYWNKVLNKQRSYVELILGDDVKMATEEDVYRDLKKVLTRKEITSIIKNEKRPSKLSPLYEGIDDYDEIFTEAFIVDGKPPEGFVSNTPEEWDVFKEIEPRTKGLSLHGEFGMNLDDWNSENIEYYISEGEWFYFPEGIARKYYFLGAQIGLQQRKEDYLNDLIQNLKPESPHYAANIAASIVRDLAADWECTSLMRRVRSEYRKRRGVDINDEFLSHSEISDSIENMDFSDLPDNLFDEKGEV